MLFADNLFPGHTVHPRCLIIGKNNLTIIVHDQNAHRTGFHNTAHEITLTLQFDLNLLSLVYVQIQKADKNKQNCNNDGRTKDKNPVKITGPKLGKSSGQPSFGKNIRTSGQEQQCGK